MKILVIPEDFRQDQYVLLPIIESMLKYVGKSQAKITICKDPLLRGISQALDFEKIREIVERYQMIDIFLLCVDRDGEESRRKKLDYLEEKVNELLPETKSFIAENAWQEIEVWILAGHDTLPKEWNWKDIRQERNPKELYFVPFAKQHNASEGLGGGRKKLAESANYVRIRQLCLEDVQDLEQRIKNILQ